MQKLNVYLNETVGKIKPMSAVNNGPCGSVVRGGGNAADYKEADFGFARLHDSAFCAAYGGEYSVDVHRVFPTFDADETDPANYVFAPTDEYLANIDASGTKIFYRLGAAIEHGYKKGTIPPKDFLKWARISEHIIRHYTEGWADGFRYDIEYWEIWNEPDTKNWDGSKPCWQGTEEEFIDFYEVVAKHLKSCFPHLKIGGPAFCSPWSEAFIKPFLARVKENNVPLDFYSYHRYCKTPEDFRDAIRQSNRLLREAGIKTETILNEWNYIRGWRNEEFAYSLATIANIKGASFTTACMCVGQEEDVDMLMYYDARPSGYNGLFRMVTYEKLKTYYAMRMFRDLKRIGTSVRVEKNGEGNVYLAAAAKDGRAAILLTHYKEDDTPEEKTVALSLCGIKGPVRVTCARLDGELDAEPVKSEYFSAEVGEIYLSMPLFTTYLVTVEPME